MEISDKEELQISLEFIRCELMTLVHKVESLMGNPEKGDTSDTFTITMFDETIDVVVQDRIDETMSRCKSSKSGLDVIVGVHNVGMEDRERFMECLERILPLEEWRTGLISTKK